MLKEMALALGGFLANFMLLSLLNNRGEAGDKTFTQAQVDALIAEKTKDVLTQDKVDAIVQDRLAREKAKYSNYDDLVKFKTDYEKTLGAKTEKELEDKKEYEKAKEGWTKKEQELSGVISKKDSEIVDMKIGNSLMTEIVKQNAYAEETMALIKSQAVFDKEGNIRIKGRDANGLEVMDSIEEGIKKFLVLRPHLVKVIQKAGGGTGAGGAGAGAGAGVGGEDLNTLNTELLQAQQRGDTKKINELKVKVRAILGAQKAML